MRLQYYLKKNKKYTTSTHHDERLAFQGERRTRRREKLHARRCHLDRKESAKYKALLECWIDFLCFDLDRFFVCCFFPFFSFLCRFNLFLKFPSFLYFPAFPTQIEKQQASFCFFFAFHIVTTTRKIKKKQKRKTIHLLHFCHHFFPLSSAKKTVFFFTAACSSRGRRRSCTAGRRPAAASRWGRSFP